MHSKLSLPNPHDYPEILDFELDPGICSDESYYFISFLSDRFIPLNDRWAEALSRRFDKVFKPIYVLPFRHNNFFKEERFIVLNKQLQEIRRQSGRADLIYMPYPEDLNKQFSESPFCKLLLKNLIKKQSQVFVLSFSSVWLHFTSKKVKILGPDAKLAEFYDNKIEHYRLFKKLGHKTVDYTLYPNLDTLIKTSPLFPYFISATYSSGGIESKVIRNLAELKSFHKSLRPINKALPLTVTKFLKDITYAPNTTALVSSLNQTTLINISDQILNGNCYMGNIYPSAVPPSFLDQITEMTLQVGNYLSTKGYRGLFGCDFLITSDGSCYPVDLNPRRQGGYYCITMASKCDLVELELRCTLDEPLLQYRDFQASYVWAHSKLTPPLSNKIIKYTTKKGQATKPFQEIGASFVAQFYPKNHRIITGNPGFYLTSGLDTKEVRSRLSLEVHELIKNLYG